VRSKKSIRSRCMSSIDSRHIVADLGEEGEGGSLVSFEIGRDRIV